MKNIIKIVMISDSKYIMKYVQLLKTLTVSRNLEPKGKHKHKN